MNYYDNPTCAYLEVVFMCLNNSEFICWSVGTFAIKCLSTISQHVSPFPIGSCLKKSWSKNDYNVFFPLKTM